MNDSIYYFTSRTYLKTYNIHVTPMMVIEVISNLNLSEGSSPDCISMVILIKCKPELSYILAELFNMYLKESSFSGCCTVKKAIMKIFQKQILIILCKFIKFCIQWGRLIKFGMIWLRLGHWNWRKTIQFSFC